MSNYSFDNEQCITHERGGMTLTQLGMPIELCV